MTQKPHGQTPTRLVRLKGFKETPVSLIVWRRDSSHRGNVRKAPNSSLPRRYQTVAGRSRLPSRNKCREAINGSLAFSRRKLSTIAAELPGITNRRLASVPLRARSTCRCLARFPCKYRLYPDRRFSMHHLSPVGLLFQKSPTRAKALRNVPRR